MRNLIRKWIVYKNKSSKNGVTFEAREIEVVKEEYENDNIEFLSCIYCDSRAEETVPRSYVMDSQADAIRVSKEKTIIRNFKFKNKKKDGTWVCGCCGKIITNIADATVDHVKPKKYFRNDNREYYSADAWEECWSEKNLAIACMRCNQKKGSFSLMTHLEIDKRKNELNRAKKRNKRNLGCKTNKIGYRIKTGEDYAVEIARRDSREWDLNKFFKKKNKPKKQ